MCVCVCLEYDAACVYFGRRLTAVYAYGVYYVPHKAPSLSRSLDTRTERRQKDKMSERKELTLNDRALERKRNEVKALAWVKALLAYSTFQKDRRTMAVLPHYHGKAHTQQLNVSQHNEWWARQNSWTNTELEITYHLDDKLYYSFVVCMRPKFSPVQHPHKLLCLFIFFLFAFISAATIGIAYMVDFYSSLFKRRRRRRRKGWAFSVPLSKFQYFYLV